LIRRGSKFDDSVNSLVARIPLARPAETHEVSVAALFLVDGGWTAGYARDS
jgi:hypothetical protein